MAGTRWGMGAHVGPLACSLLVVVMLGACEGADADPEAGEGGARAGAASSVGGALGGAASQAGATGSGGTPSLGEAGDGTGARSFGGSTSAAGSDEGGAGGSDVVSSGGVSVGGANGAGSDSVAEAGGAGETGGAAEMGGAVSAGGLGGASDVGGWGATDGVPVALLDDSWDMEVTLSLAERDGGGAFPGCPRIAFTLRTLLHVSGGPGEVWLFPVKDGEGGSGSLVPHGWAYEMPPGTPARELILPARASCSNQRVVLQAVTLAALDLDGDGVADRLSGTGSGQHYVGSSTVGSAISVEIKGVPDVTPPYLAFPEPVHPLDPWKVFTSEQFASADFVLSGNPELHPTLTFEDFTGGLLSYSTDGRVLPFSSTWTVSGSATDFVGLPLDPRGWLRTIEDPGIFPEDGFEGTTLVLRVNGFVCNGAQCAERALLIDDLRVE